MATVKSIPQIKVGNDVFDIKDTTCRDHLIEAKNEQPTDENNKLWIKSVEKTFKVPDYEEFEAVRQIAETVNAPLLTQEELDEICV